MISLEAIPPEMRKERNEKCRKCTTRKFYAKMFDMHFDWVDCPYDCEHDIEHLQKELGVAE